MISMLLLFSSIELTTLMVGWIESSWFLARWFANYTHTFAWVWVVMCKCKSRKVYFLTKKMTHIVIVIINRYSFYWARAIIEWSTRYEPSSRSVIIISTKPSHHRNNSRRCSGFWIALQVKQYGGWRSEPNPTWIQKEGFFSLCWCCRCVKSSTKNTPQNYLYFSIWKQIQIRTPINTKNAMDYTTFTSDAAGTNRLATIRHLLGAVFPPWVSFDQQQLMDDDAAATAAKNAGKKKGHKQNKDDKAAPKRKMTNFMAWLGGGIISLIIMAIFSSVTTTTPFVTFSLLIHPASCLVMDHRIRVT